LNSLRSTVLPVLLVVLSLAGCGGRAYVADDDALPQLAAAAETQQDRTITVSATVPGREQAKAIFGVDLYSQGIQPVWLEIANRGDAEARYAPVSTDRFYFSPLEVSWKNRGGYSADARAAMDRRFHSLAMPRYISPGETRSGFVFTHLDNGAKGFNVDVYSGRDAYLFTFLLRVPGFVPDYANVDFDAIYSPGSVDEVDGDGLYDALKLYDCCTGEDGEPINMVLVGEGRELLRALLRSGWIETAADETGGRGDEIFLDRRQDAIFRYQSLDRGSIYELRLWLAPLVASGERVWLGQVRHFYRLGPGQGLRRFDADVDNARNFAAQKFLYGQAVRSVAWLEGAAVVPVERFWNRVVGAPYFTDGYRLVLWLSGDPVAAHDIGFRQWDKPPEWLR
jgi:hypothetical protein